MNKKVLLIANTTGCLYNFRYGLIKRLLKDGYRVVTLAPYYSQEAYSENAVTELTSWGVECVDFNFNSKGLNPLEDLNIIRRYKKAFIEIDPDIILSYTIKSNIYGSVAARKCKLPIVPNITGLGNLYANPGILTKVANLLYKWGFKKTLKVFFQNYDDMNLFTSLNIVKKENCDRIPGSGIDLKKYKPVAKEDSEVVKFLTIGRLIWDKGYSYYIEAIKEIKKEFPNSEFMILGELGVNNPNAIPKEDVDSWVEDGLINYLGTSSDVRNEIALCDAMVLPSIYREGVPRTLIEGAALGKPIITTDNVGCRDVVDDGKSGYLCKLRDSGDLADKIKKFISLSTKDRLNMGQNSRKKIENEFDEEIVINKYMELIEGV